MSTFISYFFPKIRRKRRLGENYYFFLPRRMEGSIEKISHRLKNPCRYPKGQGPNSNPIPRGEAPRDWIWIDLGPRDEAWIFQSMTYFFDGSTFLFGIRRIWTFTSINNVNHTPYLYYTGGSHSLLILYWWITLLVNEIP